MYKGVTLVELIIVVILIGVIASFAVPGYLGAKERAEGRSAAVMLKMIQAAEKMKKLETNLYAACTDRADCNTKIDLDLPDDGWAYAVAVAGGFSATAVKAISGGTCTYTITEALDKPTASAKCAYTP